MGIPIRIELGRIGASSETRIFINDVDITSRIRGYRLIGEAGNLAKLELDLVPGKTEILSEELLKECITVIGVKSTISDLVPWLQHKEDCPGRERSWGEECDCGLEKMLNSLYDKER